MRSTAKWQLALVAAVVAFALVSVVSLVSLVTPPEPGASELAEADAWSKAIAKYPRQLPPLAQRPDEVPSIFLATDQVGLYESGLVEAVAFQFWRCSWLEHGLAGRRTGTFSMVASAQLQLSRDTGLPTPVGFDEDAAAQALIVEAESSGIHPWRLEFDAMCAEWFAGRK